MNNRTDFIELDLTDYTNKCLPPEKIETNCTQRERTISEALYVKLPDEAINPDVNFKECCYNILALGDSTGRKERNDFFGVYHQRKISSDSCQFILENQNNSNTVNPNDGNQYGVYKSFGDIPGNSNFTYWIVNWGKVLTELGKGAYKIIKTYTVAGIEYTTSTPIFNVREFDYLFADKTIRYDIKMNGLLENENVDFTDTNFESSIRVGGFFGRREPKMEQDNIVYKNKKVNQISVKQQNTYQLQTELLPECITSIIFDLFIFADEMFVNDYNLVNHSYKYINFGVVLEKNNGTKYYTQNRKARINLLFNDRFTNRNKYNF